MRKEFRLKLRGRRVTCDGPDLLQRDYTTVRYRSLGDVCGGDEATFLEFPDLAYDEGQSLR